MSHLRVVREQGDEKEVSSPIREYDPKGSNESGFAWLFEIVARKFKIFTHILVLIPLYVLGSLCIGVSVVPGFFLFHWVSEQTLNSPIALRYLSLGTALGAGYFLYGFTVIAVVPIANGLLRAKLKPWRGHYYSFSTLKWYIHNSLFYLVRYTFLHFITPTPLNHIFLKAMGMKIGDGTQVNTEFISDPSLITMGKKVTIGGSATLVGHYGMSGFLILAPVFIDDGAVIGLKSTIMAGVTIGKNARILPNSVVLPKTKIPAGETWGGVPARKLDPSSL